jgi:hypothetical protein
LPDGNHAFASHLTAAAPNFVPAIFLAASHITSNRAICLFTINSFHRVLVKPCSLRTAIQSNHAPPLSNNSQIFGTVNSALGLLLSEAGVPLCDNTGSRYHSQVIVVSLL